MTIDMKEIKQKTKKEILNTTPEEMLDEAIAYAESEMDTLTTQSI